MSNETIREIIKSHIYGVSDADIAEVNGITTDEVKKVIAENTAIEKEIRDHLKKMEVL